MNINLHAHTTRFGHASGTEKEFVEEAVRIGMTDFGFSDHTPMTFPETYKSGIRMKLEEMQDYTDTILGLRKEYEGKINIYLGLEVEYYPALFDNFMKFISDYPVEYMILGQHSLNNEYDGVWPGEPTEDASRLKRYVEQVIEGLSTGKFIYLAHPDLMNFVGDDTVYLKEMEKICAYTNDHKIMTRPIWILNNKLDMYKGCQCTDLSNAEWLEDRVVNIPSTAIIPDYYKNISEGKYL